MLTLTAVIVGGTWLLIGNSTTPVTPVGAVTPRSAPLITLPALQTPVTAPRRVTCTVHAGDTLWSISGRMYGDPAGWRRLYTLNRGTVRNPNLIYPGQTLLVS
jgi:nucleoid-associated protein YgaU